MKQKRMRLEDIKDRLVPSFYQKLKDEKLQELRPCQEKAIAKGLFSGENLIVCAPTASGKTLVAELAMINTILKTGKKAIYILPLKALANDKYLDFQRKYSDLVKIAKSTSDIESRDTFLALYDLIIITPEKLDSLLRHKISWVKDCGVFVVDEVHLLNDPSRGPTLEVLITMLRELSPSAQYIYLSATIGNPESLAEWLDANLVIDTWRPVKLKKGIMLGNNLEFFE